MKPARRLREKTKERFVVLVKRVKTRLSFGQSRARLTRWQKHGTIPIEKSQHVRLSAHDNSIADLEHLTQLERRAVE